jgi:SAM-dependent methyltransferase
VVLDWSLPWEFDPEIYRRHLPGFDAATADDLAEHYHEVGKAHGLPGDGLQDRFAFVRLVPRDAHVLEIGPFGSPVIAGPNVRYCDVLDTEQLRLRAPEHGVNPASVPAMDFVMHDCSLDGIEPQFDVVLSSHAIEHQPDLVAHLQQVERRLRPGGRYLVLVPDKRYSFDSAIPASGIADVLHAHAERRKVHTLRSLIEHHASRTHDDLREHWLQPQPLVPDLRPGDAAAVAAALREYQQAAGGYIDVHAWYFTPDSFRQIVGLLNQLDLTRLRVERLYRTRRERVEFWAVLSLEPSAGGPWDEMAAQPEPALADVRHAPGVPALRRKGGLLGGLLQSVLARR